MGPSLRGSSKIVFSCVTVIISLFLPARAFPHGHSNREETAKRNEESCVRYLRAMNAAEGTYRVWNPGEGFTRDLRELGPAKSGLLDKSVVSGRKDGYRFRYVPDVVDGSPAVKSYTITARPIKRLVRDQKGFFTDETGVIRFTTENRAATKHDPPYKDTARYGPQ